MRLPQTQTSQFCALFTTPNHACLRLQREIGQIHMRAKCVIGPDGRPLTMADLPGPKATRWVIRRKARVVAAVRGGILSLAEACSRYTLTVEEIRAWQYSYDRHGLAGLRITRTQQYRQRPGAPQTRCRIKPGALGNGTQEWGEHNQNDVRFDRDW